MRIIGPPATGEAVAALEAAADRLPQSDRALLLGLVRDHETLSTVADQLGVHPRILGRRWQVLRRDLRDALSDTAPR